MSADTMYQQYAQRVWTIGGLILLSVLAAVIGLYQTMRTLRRQLALNEMKTNFVSSVSHELRAPIASVRLMAENLQQGKVSGETKLKEYVGFIGQECRRLSSLIENVLDFSRIEQGRKQYELEPTDLTKLVEDTVRLMKPYAEEREVELMLLINDETNPEGRHSCRPVCDSENQPGDRNVALPIELNLDGRAIQQALINLIDNAIKHSPTGECVEVRLQRRTGALPVTGESLKLTNVRTATELRKRNETDRISVLLSVIDHGPGIPVDEQSKIFERFYRRGSELRRETQGIGIGLSIVKHIVEGHGGRVWVESKPGEGSLFLIQFQPQMDADGHR